MSGDAGITDQAKTMPASIFLLLLFENIPAKEDKELYRLSGKTPRLFGRDMCGIAVQS